MSRIGDHTQLMPSVLKVMTKHIHTVNSSVCLATLHHQVEVHACHYGSTSSNSAGRWAAPGKGVWSDIRITRDYGKSIVHKM